MTKKEYRSDFSIAKNLGASGSGTKHWWHQRFTAIIMALMIGWVFYFFNQISIRNLPELIEHLQKPINVVMMLIFSISMMYHGVLGMQVVIEDYVHCRIMRLAFLLGTQIFAIITTIAFIVTLIPFPI
jgi:succinate dehydrogenase / fumarate reductase, membrane anchor subunit